MSHLSKGSSSSQTASTSSRSRRAARARGIPSHCRCGEEAVMKTSGTAKNPGRLFYCCPLGSEGDKYHLFTWTDERVVEEVEDMKVILSELKDEIKEMRCEMVAMEKQVDHYKLMLEMSAKGSGSCGLM